MQIIDPTYSPKVQLAVKSASFLESNDQDFTTSPENTDVRGNIPVDVVQPANISVEVKPEIDEIAEIEKASAGDVEDGQTGGVKQPSQQEKENVTDWASVMNSWLRSDRTMLLVIVLLAVIVGAIIYYSSKGNAR